MVLIQISYEKKKTLDDEPDGAGEVEEENIPDRISTGYYT